MNRETLLSEMRATAKLAWPIIGAQVAQVGMVFVDNAMVGRLGTRELAAMAIATPFYTVCFVSAIGFLWSLNPLISQAVGAEDERQIGLVWKHGARIAFLFSLFIVLLFHLAEPILLLLGQDRELVPISASFLKTISWGIPGHMSYVALRQVTEATSNPRPSLFVAASAFLLNFLLDYVLIYGNFGFPKLGVVGSACATAIVGWYMFGAMTLYVRKHPRYRRIREMTLPETYSREMFRKITRLGLPIAGTWLGEVGYFCTATIVMGWIGTVPLAAHQVALNAASIAFMIPMGLSVAISVRVGTALGQKSRERAEIAGNAGYLLTAGAMTFTALLFLVFPAQVLAIYTKDPAVIRVGASLLVVGGIFQLFDGLQAAGTGVLRGLHETRAPMFNALISYWLVGFPLSLILAFRTPLGPTGVWWGMVLGLGTAAYLHYHRFRKSIRIWIAPA
jgi:multidrug resistance protein, MATE family